MATEYVNLDLTGTGGSGISTDPWTALDFVTRYETDAPAGTTFKIRGSFSTTVHKQIYAHTYQDYILEAWDLELYGPWRIYNGISSASEGPLMTINGYSVKDCILFTEDTVAGTATLNVYANNVSNCYLYSEHALWLLSINDTIKGCTLLTGTDSPDSGIMLAAAAVVEDSIILNTASVKPSSYVVIQSSNTNVFKNCCFNTDSLSTFDNAPSTVSDCEYSWSEPTLPAFDGDSADFAIFTGISTPPQPGIGVTGDYYGYSTDLWGNARTGIGAGYMGSTGSTGETGTTGDINYFSSNPARNGIAVLSTVNTAKLLSLLTGDALFNSASKIKRVDVFYYHALGRQLKWLIHTAESNMTCSVAWSVLAQPGTWYKNRVVVYDNDGATHELKRYDIGSSEDVTIV